MLSNHFNGADNFLFNDLPGCELINIGPRVMLMPMRLDFYPACFSIGFHLRPELIIGFFGCRPGQGQSPIIFLKIRHKQIGGIRSAVIQDQQHGMFGDFLICQ